MSNPSITHTIAPALFPSDELSVRSLFSSYQRALSISDTDNELDNLPGVYAAPRGLILVASAASIGAGGEVEDDYGAVGCVALRPVGASGEEKKGVMKEKDSARVCEIRYLYVWKDVRGHGIGKRLVKEAVERAGKLGYGRVVVVVRTEGEEDGESGKETFEGEGFEVVEKEELESHAQLNREVRQKGMVSMRKILV